MGNHADKEVRVFCRALHRGSLSGLTPTHKLVTGDGAYALWSAVPLHPVESVVMPAAASTTASVETHPVGILYVLRVGSLVLLTERVTRRAGHTNADTVTFVLTAAHLRRCCDTPEKLIAHARRKAESVEPGFARRFPRTVMSMSHTRVLQRHMKLLAPSNASGIRAPDTVTGHPVTLLTHGAVVVPLVRELPVVVIHHVCDEQPIFSLWMLLFLLLAVVIGKWLVGNQRPSEVWSALRQND
jgi:hypothetical protein